MVMDSSRKKGYGGGERKILGIPIISLAVIVALFMCVVYYASGYASENTKLIEKYGIAKAKILSISRMVEKMDSKQKICQSNLQQNEQSNRDLTLQASQCKSAKQEEESQRVQCQSQITTFQQFYTTAKEKLGHDDGASPKGITGSDLEVIVNDIVKLNVKISKYENDQAKCAETQDKLEDLKRSNEKFIEGSKDHEDQLKNLGNENARLNKELENVRKLLNEADEKVSHFENHEHKKGFQRKKEPQGERNVRMEILDKKKEQPKPVNHESGEVKTSQETTTTTHSPSNDVITGKNEEEESTGKSSDNTSKSTNLSINNTSTASKNLTTKSEILSASTNTTTIASAKTSTPSAITKKPMATEEDDDLEAGFENSKADYKIDIGDFDTEPKNDPDSVPAIM